MDRYDHNLLMEIKSRLNLTGTFHDATLMGLAQDVRQFMFSAGVNPRLVNGESAIGCIARGVADLWNFGAGDGKFSEIFMQRVIQLATPLCSGEDGSDMYDAIDHHDIDDMFGFPGVPKPDYRPRKPDFELANHHEIDCIIGPTPHPKPPELANNEDIGDIIEFDWDELGPEPPEPKPEPRPPHRPHDPPWGRPDFGKGDWYGEGCKPRPRPPKEDYAMAYDIDRLFGDEPKPRPKPKKECGCMSVNDEIDSLF